jgi:doublesex- and mab-3-related transcription factor 4/5
MNTTGSRPEPVSVASTSNSSYDTNTSSSLHNRRTKPTCARCRNHYLLTPVKGHKRSCRYRDCTCVKCHVVAEGGRFRAMQLWIWRHVERQRRAMLGEKKRLRKTDRDMSSETESDKFCETATPSAPGTDSNAVAESDAFPSLYGCYTVQNPSTSHAPNAIRIIPPPQLQQRLTPRYHPHFESDTPLNAAETMVEETRKSLSSISISAETQSVVPSDLQNNSFCTIPHQQLSHMPQNSSETQPGVSTAWMTNHSVTIPPTQSIPWFTNSGPFTTAATPVTDMCSTRSGSYSLSPAGSTSGPGTYNNIASSIIQQSQQYPQFSPACCQGSTNYALQPQAVSPKTDLLSMRDGSGSLSSSFTTNTTVPNVPNVCKSTPCATIPQPNTKIKTSRFGKNSFAPYTPLNDAADPRTDFRSVDSLSSSFTSKISGTQPVIPSDRTNVGRTSIPTCQPVMRPSQCSCGNLPSHDAAGTSYYGALIQQYYLNSLFLKGS